MHPVNNTVGLDEDPFTDEFETRDENKPAPLQ